MEGKVTRLESITTALSSLVSTLCVVFSPLLSSFFLSAGGRGSEREEADRERNGGERGTERKRGTQGEEENAEREQGGLCQTRLQKNVNVETDPPRPSPPPPVKLVR